MANAQADLEQLLSACLSQDNQARKHAEELLKEGLKRPEAIPELVHKLQTSADPQVRQLAALLLRKRISKKWIQLRPEVQQQTKQLLLQRIVEEQVAAVRRAIADLVGVIARHAVPKQQWPELLQFLYECSKSQDAGHREVALSLFASLLGTIGEELAAHAVQLMQIITAGLQDPHPSVVSAALQAVEPLLYLVKSQQEVAAFHQLLSALLQLAEKLVGAKEEDILLTVFQVLGEVSEVGAPLLQPGLATVVQLCGVVGCNRDMQPETRAQALEVLHVLVRNKPKQLTKLKLVGSMVEAMCQMACESVISSNSEDDDESLELPPHKMACQLLDEIALNLPSKQVFPKVMAFVQHALASPDPNLRCGCMDVLAAVCEGCCEVMRNKLDEVLRPVMQALQDPEVQVRGSAVFALAQYSDFLQPEMASQHAVVLPVVLQAMQEPTKSVQERAFCALDAFCENMGPEIADYVEQLVVKIMAVLQGGNRDLQEMALSALASMLSAASHPFTRFAGTLVPVLEHFMQLTSIDALDCRCRATECAGFIVDVVAAEALPTVADRLMELGLRGFTLSYPSLREYSHDMFGHVARTMGPGFGKYLQYVVPLAYESCRLDDACALSGDDDDENDSDAEGHRGHGHNILAGLSDDDDDDDHERQLSIRTGVTDEKAAATQALGLYASSSLAAFAPYLEETLQVLKGMARYFHEGVRSQAYEALGRLVTASQSIFPAPAGASSSQEVQQLMTAVIDLLLRSVVEEHDKLAAGAALSAVLSMVKMLGASCVAPYLERVMDAVKVVLNLDAACQTVYDDEEGDVEDDKGDEEDEELFATACEAFPVMAEVAGAATYGPIFATHHYPLLAAHLKPQGTPNGWRATVTGCLAEVTQKIQGFMSPHVEKLVPILIRETRVEDSINRQNAAFCLGILVHACPQESQPVFPQILQALHPLCANPEENPSVRDNAVGAVSRMLLCAAPALPVEQILPSLLDALPIREDVSECVPTYQALCQLLTTDQAARCAGSLPQIFRVLGAVLVQPRTEQVRGSVALVVAQLQKQHPQEIGSLVDGWTEQQRAALSAALACQPHME